MPRRHRAFWLDLLTKIGVPVFAATLVGCLLTGEFELVHAVLLATGLALIFLGHRVEYHGDADSAQAATPPPPPPKPKP
ncbi:MAG: hypothetical protein ACYTGP_01665 [Planctomycetota bacterium]|jgi:hypothetical protein